MPKIEYVPKRFSSDSKSIIVQANQILKEYDLQGFVLTLRQLYYQFVARDLLSNNQKSYNRLGSIINNARLAGLIDWNHLIDRTRNLSELEHFQNASDALNKLAGWYHIDLWERQEYRPEVWIEKDALVGVIEDVCQELDVPYFSCRGYTSQSEMWRAGVRLKRHCHQNQTPFIFHFGDHDPSGKDMSRDIRDRLDLFMEEEGLEFERVALNMNQIKQYNPPPNPTKITDSRARIYMAEFGNESWELDALEPSVLVDLVRVQIEGLRDDLIWKEDLKEKEDTRQKLIELAKGWE